MESALDNGVRLGNGINLANGVDLSNGVQLNNGIRLGMESRDRIMRRLRAARLNSGSIRTP
jgi:hypothetical protein